MITDRDPVLVTLDARRRLTLSVGRHDRYLVREESDGTLIFEPAVVWTVAEARLAARPDVVARVVDAVAHPERMRPRG